MSVDPRFEPPFRPLACAALAAGVALTLAACATRAPDPQATAAAAPSPPSFTDIGYANWREDQEPEYRLYPGDVLDVAVPSAPELNHETTVQPDGRITMPLLPPIMAADRSVPELAAELTQAYTSQLVRPRVEVSVKAATPLRVFVGGEVGKPGVYDMPGDIDALQAVIMAGGFTVSADRHDVVIIRRGAGGRPMMRTADLKAVLHDAPNRDAVPLRRFDIIYVPKSGIAKAGQFVQQYIRDVVPIEFSYAVSPNAYATVP